ncbi:RNA polymerase sigma factor [Pedobacter sp.]|uniref:RNA polymerase sigma factor n=1 Tax=Pedobacter sp. TaxID=1411316 RepID=UPI003D7FD293
MQQPTDEAIIKAILAGNTSAYADLVRRHQRFVFTMAMKFTRNREDAEEVAQDSFIKAYRALATFKQDAKFSTWLYTITYTTAMSFLRKKRVLTQSIDEEESSLQLQNHISAYNADVVEQKSKYAYLNLAISMLAADDAALINLFYQAEQSLLEIAKVLNMESNTVKVKLHRARIRLKEKLEYLLKEEVKEL